MSIIRNDKDDKRTAGGEKRTSGGPLRIYEEGGNLFVTGFGLWLPVQSEEEGRELIAELEDQGYRICW